MHGIRKTEVSEAEREAKAKEREKKLQLYVKVRDVIFEKIHNGVFDEQGLVLTYQLLSKNPDIYTFWNYRKKALLNLKLHQAETAENDFDSKLCIELELTEACLQKNPKSYGAWHHRGWALMQMKNPNYLREIKQCEEALTLDERNFHCWDHWRIVCKLANLSSDEQIKFSDKKVKENFSNYSAWHYRSTLLPNSYPDPNGCLSVDNAKFLSELEMVHNAFFTDPDDQSSWFYRNWLFRRVDNDEKRFEIERFYVDKGFKKLFILFVKSVVLKPEILTISVGDTTLTGLNWTAIGNSDCDRFWAAQVDNVDNFCETLPIKLCIDGCNSVELANPINSGEVLEWRLCENTPGFCLQLTEDERKNFELDLVQTLELSKLESDKKWPLLTSIVSMKTLNFLKYENKIFDGLKTLMTIDSFRQHYYADLASKWRMETVILANYGADLLNFTALGLTTVHHADFMTNVTDLDLSRNQLKSISTLAYLFNLQYLNVSSNQLTNLETFKRLKRLQYVDISSNLVERIDNFFPILECSSLKTVNIKDNPIGKVTFHNQGSEDSTTFGPIQFIS